MSNAEDNSGNPAASRLRHYADILNPLFWHDDFYDMDRLFEWACTVVRASGLKDTGWDSYTESLALLNDFTQLQQIELPTDNFPRPDDTRVRLALASYSHLIEMSFPYEILANLLRLRINLKYSVDPLSHLDRPIEKKIDGVKVVQKIISASPDKKIIEIEEMSAKAGLPGIGEALRNIYSASIRNAFYHSDYAIHDNSMRLLSGKFFSKKEGVYTPLIGFEELAEITNEAFAFHSALFSLWKRARVSFTDFRDKFLPYDLHYKGILQFTFDGDTLTGFRTYWPNGTICICVRGMNGESYAQNIRFDPDGSINFMIGVMACKPGAFSPCVEDGDRPLYALAPGADKRPYWPDLMEAYEL